MQKTFLKTVEGHILEFNRFLYPVRYTVLLQRQFQTGIVIIVEKDPQEMWFINPLLQLPGWVREITSNIFDVIAENESPASSN